MALIKCPECGKEISDLADVCINCGFPVKKYTTEVQQTRACAFCGSRNEAGVMYCKHCGMKIGECEAMNNTTQYGQEEALKKPESWKTAVIFLCCIVTPFTLIGIVLMWIWEIPLKRDKRIIFTILAIVYAALFNLQMSMR